MVLSGILFLAMGLLVVFGAILLVVSVHKESSSTIRTAKGHINAQLESLSVPSICPCRGGPVLVPPGFRPRLLARGTPKSRPILSDVFVGAPSPNN